MAREPAYITPSVIKWARESARMDLDTAAQKIGVKPDKIESWERGEALPTIKQAQEMSRVYRRALSVFYLPEPPEDFQTLRDFRKPDQQEAFSTKLTFILREVQTRQVWLREFLMEEEEEPLPFIGRFSSGDDIATVANDIKQTLGIDDDLHQTNRLKYWIQKAEEQRIFISLASNFHSRMVFDVDEFRGFALCDDMAPVIFINTQDSPKAQLFTLVHELVHLWINESGVSREVLPEFREQNADKLDPTEVFCNQVASTLLMPDEMMEEAFREATEIHLEDIDDASKRLQVSSKAVLVWLRSNNKLGKADYTRFWQDITRRSEEWVKKQEKKKKEQSGHPDSNLLQLRKCGNSFTHIVLNGYKSGRLSGAEASSLLDVKIERFPKLEQHLQV